MEQNHKNMWNAYLNTNELLNIFNSGGGGHVQRIVGQNARETLCAQFDVVLMTSWWNSTLSDVHTHQMCALECLWGKQWISTGSIAGIRLNTSNCCSLHGNPGLNLALCCESSQDQLLQVLSFTPSAGLIWLEVISEECIKIGSPKCPIWSLPKGWPLKKTLQGWSQRINRVF